jgi:hypothetical protein
MDIGCHTPKVTHNMNYCLHTHTTTVKTFHVGSLIVGGSLVVSKYLPKWILATSDKIISSQVSRNRKELVFIIRYQIDQDYLSSLICCDEEAIG